MKKVYIDPFTYHIVNIKLGSSVVTVPIVMSFTYHIVNIKLNTVFYFPKSFFLFTYHIVNIKLRLYSTF